MDVISYASAAQANDRIEKINANPDSDSGIVTQPMVIATGESVTVPTGRIAVLPNLQIDGELVIDGNVFVPSGATVGDLEDQIALKADIADVDLKAPLNSPALTGTPTAPTPEAGTNTTQLATTAFVKAQGYLGDTAHSFATAGYQRLSNGLIIQWGASGANTSNVTFPITFPTVCLQAVCSQYSPSVGDIGSGKMNITAVSASGFTMYASQASVSVRYMAIGC